MHLSAAHALHEADKRTIVQLRQQVAALETELAALKNGHGIALIIAGQRFDLAPDDVPAQLSEQQTAMLNPEHAEHAKARVGSAFLADVAAGEPVNGHKNGVEDSFVL
jgi:hypothetical protein